jgi:hypothetical protein
VLYLGHAHDRMLHRTFLLGALVGLFRSAKELNKGLQLERFDGDVVAADYAALGFRPPADGSPRLAR